ncbi:hypothetical protein [Desulfolutivibrio sulfoxidireducens]|uniref:hypothetical protein n=1 Tax=Desulfolutivibrio sulfoxidireducens TaxID=2773299 RepID=UPI00159D48E2|nr:hypothetical protein [Desulfolutivibrio sulfoxidireducens]
MSTPALYMMKEPIIRNGGLLTVGELLRISGIDGIRTHRESANHPDRFSVSQSP